jgi:hypothetical protein
LDEYEETDRKAWEAVQTTLYLLATIDEPEGIEQLLGVFSSKERAKKYAEQYYGAHGDRIGTWKHNYTGICSSCGREHSLPGALIGRHENYCILRNNSPTCQCPGVVEYRVTDSAEETAIILILNPTYPVEKNKMYVLGKYLCIWPTRLDYPKLEGTSDEK